MTCFVNLRPALALAALSALLSAQPTFGGNLFSQHRLTETAAVESSPIAGRDNISEYVAYAIKSGSDPADIYAVRHDNGVPSGSPISVATGPNDYRYFDASGDYILYAEHANTGTAAGRLMLYHLPTSFVQPLDSADELNQPRICGNHVVWTEGPPGSTQLMYYNLDWLISGDTAILLAGPDPAVTQIEVGDRFVVWCEEPSGDYNIRVWDLTWEWGFDLAVAAGVDEIEPVTDGPWIVFRRQEQGGIVSTIEATNLDSFETLTIADNDAMNYRPRISGDVVTWESEVGGGRDLYLHELTQYTQSPVGIDTSDDLESDIYGGVAVFVADSSSSEDLFVTVLPQSFCCLGTAGNIDDDPNGAVNISDLTYMVASLFQGGADPACNGEGNVDGSPDGAMNISDLTYLVSSLFQGGADPAPCDPAGDPIAPELIGEWTIIGCLVNGAPADLSVVLGFTPGAVSATYTLTGEGIYEYREKDDGGVTLWTETGVFGIAGEYAVSRETLEDGIPISDGYVLNWFTLIGPVLHFFTMESGNVMEFTLTQ